MPEVPAIVKREPGASIKTVPFTGQLASGSQIQAPGAVNFRSPSPQRQAGGVNFSAVVTSVQSDPSSSGTQDRPVVASTSGASIRTGASGISGASRNTGDSGISRSAKNTGDSGSSYASSIAGASGTSSRPVAGASSIAGASGTSSLSGASGNSSLSGAYPVAGNSFESIIGYKRRETGSGVQTRGGKLACIRGSGATDADQLTGGVTGGDSAAGADQTPGGVTGGDGGAGADQTPGGVTGGDSAAGADQTAGQDQVQRERRKFDLVMEAMRSMHSFELFQAKAKHDDEVWNLKYEHDNERKQHAAEIQRLKRQHESDLVSQAQSFEKELARRKVWPDYQSQKAALEKTYQDRVDVATAKLDVAERSFKTALQAMEGRLNEYNNRHHEASIKALRASYDARIEAVTSQLEAQKRAEIADFRAQHQANEARLNALVEGKDAQIAGLKKIVEACDGLVKTQEAVASLPQHIQKAHSDLVSFASQTQTVQNQVQQLQGFMSGILQQPGRMGMPVFWSMPPGQGQPPQIGMHGPHPSHGHRPPN